jgi:hypothetical protein
MHFSPMHDTCTAHLIILDLIIPIIFGGVEILKLLIIHFSLAACYFVPLRSIYSPQCPAFKGKAMLLPLISLVEREKISSRCCEFSVSNLLSYYHNLNAFRYLSSSISDVLGHNKWSCN